MKFTQKALEFLFLTMLLHKHITIGFMSRRCTALLQVSQVCIITFLVITKPNPAIVIPNLEAWSQTIFL